MHNQVFISYRQEGPEHNRAVRRLGELLRQSGLPVLLDQLDLDERPGGPDLGWAKWSEDCANQSPCVPIVASPGWFAAYDKSGPPGLGLGAADPIPVRRRTIHRFRPFQTDAESPMWTSRAAAPTSTFDTHEQAADNRSVADWLGQQLLAEVETALGLTVVVAGQRVPPMAGAPWRDLARHIPLQPIAGAEHWVPWLERRHPGIDHGRHLETILLATAGHPATISTLCEAIARNAAGGATGHG
jgi:hypothetical protein